MIPERVMNCDFETFSEIDIKVGSFRYAQDPTTEILCIAYGFDKNSVKLWHPGMVPPVELINHIEAGGLVSAWNATFEYAIFNHVGTKLHGWPKLNISQMRCTQANALALSLPAGLDGASMALGLNEQKDKRGKQLITKLCKPRKPTKNKSYNRVTKEIDPESFQELYDYCVQDVVVEMAVAEMLPREIKGEEQKLFELTLKINERGIPFDHDLVKAVLKSKGSYQERLNLEIEELTDGQLVSTGSIPKSLKWLKENGLELPDFTKAEVKKALGYDDLPTNVRRFLEIRSELSRTPIKKYDFIDKAICEDGTLKNNIIYHKATTGRYAGTGFQIQNLPRDAAENPEELITQFKTSSGLERLNIYDEGIKLIRSSVCASPGKKLVVSDFSSIENRVIAWIAQDWSTIQDFVDGLDQYKTAASSIYAVDYDKVTKDQRQLGKIAVLSCGFGGGWKTFQTVCATSWGVYITEGEAKDIVAGYREKYYKVVQLWHRLYDAAMEAIIAPGIVKAFNGVKFRLMGDFLYMRLPNGRMVAYYKPKLQKVMTPWGQEKLAITHMGNNTYTRKWERLTVIPGRLTENVVQAVARDCLTEAMLRVEKAGYNIIACVHDEIISLVDESFGNIDDFNKIMAATPTWAIELPIAAEGYEAKRYRK